jgi:hypothetical protein
MLMLLHARAAKTELRNSYSSIHRLPEDIIQRVFLFVRPDHLDSVRGHHEYFVILTHVCAPWRRMAMASPLLWTRLPCADPAHTVWVLEHVAGLTALDIRLDITESFTRVADWSRPKRTPIIRGLFDHAARMRRVVISTSSGSLEEDAFDILRNFVSSPARTLEVFALEYDGGEAHARWFTPEALFNHEAPMLTELRLIHTIIQPEWRVLQHLSILKIVEPVQKLLLSPLLDLLSSMKLLSSLILYNVLSADIPGLSVLEQKVAALAGLEYLLVVDELARLVPFLASLRLRPGSLKQLRIVSHNNNNPGSVLVDTLLRLPLCTDFARYMSRDARFCMFSERYDGMLLRFMLREAEVTSYSRYCLEAVHSSDTRPMLDLDVRWCNDSTRRRGPLGQWLPNTPTRYSIMQFIQGFPSLHSFKVYIVEESEDPLEDPRYPDQFWLEALGPSSSTLTHIECEIERNSRLGLVIGQRNVAMSAKQRDPVPGLFTTLRSLAEGGVFLPKLQQLTLRPAIWEDEQMMLVIRDTLRFRATEGFLLPMLKLTTSGLGLNPNEEATVSRWRSDCPVETLLVD